MSLEGVELVKLKNHTGLSASVLSYGATLQSVKFPDKEGNPIDVVLGFDTVHEYVKDNSHFGRTVGRVCNRIGYGKFTLEGKVYQRNWELICRSEKSATFAVQIRSAEDKYPGDVLLKVTYTVNDRNQLIIEHFAESTEATIVNMTNHAYWNLDGGPSVLDHSLSIAADHYLTVDDTTLPTGVIERVDSTPLDFRKSKKIGRKKNTEICDCDIDNDFILPPREKGASALTIQSPVSGIRMELATSYPVVHIYSATHLNGELTGKGGKCYDRYAGLAIEPQKYTDAPNHPQFPTIKLAANDIYSEEMVYTFTNVD